MVIGVKTTPDDDLLLADLLERLMRPDFMMKEEPLAPELQAKMYVHVPCQ
jgi:hypothetical protein